MSSKKAGGPPVALLEAAALAATQREIFAGEPRLEAADSRLLEEADWAMTAGPFSVIDKAAEPPSGDKRDYMSLAPYWWPDPQRPEGPYRRRDGQINEEGAEYDRGRLDRMCAAVDTLALAYYLSELEDFADHAALLLRAWFLDEATGMKPHLRYGQAIPGRCQGRGQGIIDTAPFSGLLDSVGLLEGSAAWSAADCGDLAHWFKVYLDWLHDSPQGREEAGRTNNHGTWYDVQVSRIALFVGRADTAGQILAARGLRRLAEQIGADGRQPLELARSRSLEYSSMNLMGLFDLARLGAVCGVDLWAGGEIERAFGWLMRHAWDKGAWPGEQIVDFDRRRLVPLLRRGAVQFGDADAEARLQQVEGAAADRSALLYRGVDV